MKKLFPFFLLLSFIFISCPKGGEKVVEEVKETVVSEFSVNRMNSGEEAFNAIRAKSFELNYSPLKPEVKKEAGKIDMSQGSAGASSSDVDPSVIPGLRNIKDYQTNYYTDKSIKEEEIVFADKTVKAEPSNEPFTIVDWGPQGQIPSQVKNPSFYVLFSEPVIPVASLKDPSSNSEYMSINPKLEGVFRWYGTSLLSFESSQAADPLQSYTITVSDKIKSISGKNISGKLEYSTTAAPLKINYVKPGVTYSKETHMWFGNDDVPFEACKEAKVTFNYDVKAEDIAKRSEVYAGYDKAKFTVKQETSNSVTYNITFASPLKDDQDIKIRVYQPDGEDYETASYSTLQPFEIEYLSAEQSEKRYINPVYIRFSHPVKEDTVLGNISTEPYMEITKENIKVEGLYVKVFNLPVTFGDSYKITVKTGIKDIYDRPLSRGRNYTVEVPDAASEAEFQNSGMKMLEAQFPHKLVFAYQNPMPNSVYAVEKTDRPYISWREDRDPSSMSGRKILPVEPKNVRRFEVVDLDPYLKNGKGWIRFDADIKVKNNYSNRVYDRTNNLSVQVTDLGVTVRYAINKVVVLVTKLSDGSPVEGAKVSWYDRNITESRDSMAEQSLCQGTTGKNGLVVLNTNFEFVKYPAVLVEKDDDAVTFNPDSHSPWRSGIYDVRGAEYAAKTFQRTFIFTDRGLYKPGEKMSFRGIDRDQLLGEFTSYKGNYTVRIQESTWYQPRIVYEESGVTSSSGGFYGYVQLPDDLEPGEYKISYKRDDSEDWENCYFTVAYFERIKFQAGITIPQVPLTIGDTVQGELKASYLAGGALSGASYWASWFKEPWYFSSDDPEFKGFRFGPWENNGGRSYFNDERGVLSTNGTAKLSAVSTDDGLKGVPYVYRVSANVTDISNQSIGAASSAVVHPALYYIGLAKQAGSSGFAKAGQTVTFDYKIAGIDGSAAANAKEPAKLLENLAGMNKNLKVTLNREDWTLVQQNGVYGGVYTRYEKTMEQEYEGSVSLAPSGKISVTPKKPGYYILKVEGKDSKGRDVLTDFRFFVTGSGNVSWYQEDSSSIRLTPDQSMYNPGDTAHVLMESVLPAGDYLITVEREGIYTEEVRHFDSTVSVIDIPVARNYVPVVYVSVSSFSVRTGAPVHEYGETDLDKPKGYYGIATIHVDPYVKAFSIDVKSAKPSYRPGEEATVTLTATRGGKPLENAELTLMAVDRGVLDLINYHVPDPVSFFYNEYNFPLCVWGGDSRAYLMDPVTYEVKNLQGGDESDDDKMEERVDFDATAVFEPVLVTDKNGQVTCTFKLPDTLTTYRVTAFGVCGELVALQEDEIGVKNPINVQQVLPRRLRERDTAELGVLITNLDGSDHKLTVELEVETPEQGKIAGENGRTKVPGNGFVDGPDSRTIDIKSGQNAVVYFDVAAVKAGVVNMIFTVKSDILNERIVCPVVIEKPYIFETFTSIGAVTGDEAKGIEQIALPKSVDNQGELTLTLDATRLGTLSDAIQYVFHYPYGCMEQQSSAILPLVLFEEYIDVFGLEKDEKINDVRKVVSSTIKQWKNVQHSSGGFPYWPNGYSDNFYVSTRIAHIYALAKARGYSDSELGINKKKLLNYLKSEVERKTYHSDYMRAYAYYVLSLHGEAIYQKELEALYNKTDDISVISLVGLTYLEINGMSSGLADACRTKVCSFIRPGTRGAEISNDHLPWNWSWYSTDSSRYALALQFLTKMDANDQLVTRLLFTLLERQKTGYWESTDTTAKVLDAVYTVIKESGLDNLNLEASASIMGKELASGSFKDVAAKPVTVTIPFTNEALSSLDKNTLYSLEYEKSGNGNLFYTTSLKYAIPYEKQNARDEGLSVTMVIKDSVTGEEIKPDSKTGEMKLESGRVYSCDIRLSSTRDREFVALRAPVPSGAEILDATFVTTPSSESNEKDSYYYDEDDWYDYEYSYSDSWGHWMSNQVIYDNEIQFFWDYFAKGETTASFKFRAVRRGVYPCPPATSECMYEPEVFGRTAGNLFTIK